MLRRLMVATVPALALLASACGSDKKAESTATTAAPAAATTAAGGYAVGGATTAAPSGGSTITVADFAFSPTPLTVKAGTAVEIKNTQGVAHTFTADDGSFDLELDPNGGASHTFKTAGSFAYHCEIHPTMKGTVVVEG